MKSMYSTEGAQMKMSPTLDSNPVRCYHQQSYSTKSLMNGTQNSSGSDSVFKSSTTDVATSAHRISFK